MASKSLGQLTLDLIAKIGGFTGPLDQASRRSQKWAADVKKHAAVAGQAIAAAAGLAAGAGALWVKSTVEAATEVARLAQISNASTTEFQKAAFAAQSVGIEQDKLADIYKDVNDRVGEFLETGGGPMLDFFKNIAPYVGVTAEEFRKLSGPEALGLYVKSLEKAGLSQQEMTFYLEAMASDTTSLIPLLREGGKGMADMATKAEDLGLILDEKTIKGAQQFNKDLDLLGRVAGGVGQKVAAELLPELTKLTGLLKDPETVENATKLAKAIVSVVSTTVEAASGTVGFLDWVGESVASAVNGPAIGDIVRLQDRLEKLTKFADEQRSRGRAVPQSTLAEIDELNTKLRLSNELREDAARVAFAAEQAAQAQAAAEQKAAEEQVAAGEEARKNREEQRKLDEAAAEAKKESDRIAKEAARNAARAAEEAVQASRRRAEAIAQEIASLEYQVDTLKMSTDEEHVHRLATEGATKAQQEYAASLLATISAHEAKTQAEKDAQAEQDRINSQAAAVIEGLMTREEAVKASYERQRELILESTEVTEGERAQALLRLQAKTDEQLLEANAGYWEQWLSAAEDNLTNFDKLAGTVIENFSGQFGDAFESMVFDAESLGDAVHGMAEGMARSVVNALGQMAGQWLAYKAVQMLVGTSTASSGAIAMVANAQASSMLAGINAFASTAAIPVVGPAAAPAAMAAALAATAPMVAGVSAAAFSGIAGQAHDGIMSIPEDGTWNLKKGERVTTAETSAKLDATLDRVQAGMGGGRRGNDRPLQVVFNQSATDSKGVREANAQASRQISRIVRGSTRYD